MRNLIASVVVIAGLCGSASAQNTPPFFGGGGVGFDPEISVVNTGAINDAQVVVSEDRRYVTINARPSLTRLQALTVFPVGGFTNGPAMGFVGGAGYIEDNEQIDVLPGTPAPKTSSAEADRKARAPARAPQRPTGHVSSSPSQILKTDTTAANSVLRKEGMHLIAPLE